jgi:hypothetical protein
VERRRQVHRQRLVPVLGPKRLDGREVTDHGVVDQDIDRAQAAYGRFDQGSDLPGLGEIGAMMERPHAVAVLELAALALDLGAVAEAVQHDVAAFGDEACRHRVAQPLRRAGDERAFAVQHENPFSCSHVGRSRSRRRS